MADEYVRVRKAGEAALVKNWVLLSAYARDNGLPMPISKGKTEILEGFSYRTDMTRATAYNPAASVKRDIAEKYACGYYGCVYPTPDSGTVFKLTTDEAEAFFAANYPKLAQLEGMEGVVQYYGVVNLIGQVVDVPDQIGGSHTRRLWAIWRESARPVDLLGRLGHMISAAQWNGRRIFIHAKTTSFPSIQDKWKVFEEAWNRTLDEQSARTRLETAMQEYVETFTDLISGREGGHLAGLLYQQCWVHGLVLADLHRGNFGIVKREPQPVAFDCGMLVRVTREFEFAEIPGVLPA